MIAYVFQTYLENFAFQLFIKTLRLKNFNTIMRKISVFAICVEAIIYLLLYYLHDCTF